MPNKIVDPCETCGKKSLTTQECYSGAKWGNRPQWWKTPKATPPKNIPIPPQPQGQYIKDTIQLAQTQHHNQTTSQMGYQPPVQMTTQPHIQNQDRKNLSLPHLQFEETVETRHYTTSEPPNSYDREENDECHEQPSLDWQRRWQIHTLNRHRRQNLDKKDYPLWYLENPTDYETPKRPLPESTNPETYVHDPDFNCDPYYNPQIYDKTTLTFKQRECTPFEEFIKQTGINISTESRQRPKHIQPSQKSARTHCG